jgi:hypothetical protein
MPVDLTTLPPATRQKYIGTGRYFSSKDTLKQGRDTLGAMERYGAEVGGHGFDAEDAADLRQACTLLVEAGVDRESAQGERKTTSKAYLDAMKQGKKARAKGRSLLKGSVRRLEQRTGSEETINQVRTTLGQTRRSGADADALASQLERIGGMLSSPAVAPVVAERGGPAAVAALSSAATTLRAVATQRPVGSGTPEETERLDLIDGLIVELVRDARRAARSAADELSRPALAKAFELNALYGKPSSAVVDEPPAETATPPAEPTPA